MTSDGGLRGLALATGTGTTQLVDVHCGDCPACRVDRDYWCFDPRPTGPVLGEVAAVEDPDVVRSWVSALAALAVAKSAPSSVLLVLADMPTDLLTVLVAPWHEGPVVAGADIRDARLRTALAELSDTGRAQIVLTVSDVRTAVRAVQRGGQVCGPDAAVPLPSVTELVQRDVSLLSARTIAPLADGGDWSGLTERLDAALLSSGATGVSR